VTLTGGAQRSARERERAGGALALVGRCGLKVGMGRGVGWVCFLFFLKSISNRLQTLLNQFFTQISPTISKGFSQTLLSTFQTYFKCKPSPFNSSFYTNFHKLFHNYFKDFSQIF
jgi:hypothetical protein